MELNDNGIREIYFNKNDERHRIGGPAFVLYSSHTGKKIFESYYVHGVVHRIGDKPATIEYDSSGHVAQEAYYLGGHLHRDGNKPAKIDHETQTEEYWFDAKRHRYDGPYQENNWAIHGFPPIFDYPGDLPRRWLPLLWFHFNKLGGPDAIGIDGVTTRDSALTSLTDKDYIDQSMADKARAVWKIMDKDEELKSMLSGELWRVVDAFYDAAIHYKEPINESAKTDLDGLVINGAKHRIIYFNQHGEVHRIGGPAKIHMVTPNKYECQWWVGDTFCGLDHSTGTTKPNVPSSFFRRLKMNSYTHAEVLEQLHHLAYLGYGDEDNQQHNINKIDIMFVGRL